MRAQFIEILAISHLRDAAIQEERGAVCVVRTSACPPTPGP